MSNNITLKYGDKYTLSESEQELIVGMAKDICSQDRSYFVKNYQVDKSLKLYDLNINGFGAELAFCKLCDIEFDSTTIENENHFKKVDATLKNGIKVDVKNTKYKSGKLLVRIGKEAEPVDVYALMIGTFPSFTFSGWAKSEQIINPSTIKDLGHGNGYVMTQDELNKELKID